MARRRKGMPKPPQTINIHITYDSYNTLLQTKTHKDEPFYEVVNRFIGKYFELKNISFQEYQYLSEELTKYKEHLHYANIEINRVKQKNKELEDINEKLKFEIYQMKKQEQQIIEIQN